MVTTRSGKPVLSSSKPSTLGRAKPKASSIFIFEDAAADIASKKRESPCKTVKAEIKKTKLGVVDKENLLNVIIPPPTSHGDVKKIQISQDEKEMSGAPEGDLFEMVVFEDAELWPFSNDEEAAREFHSSCKLHKETTVWAEQYEAVVVIRRVVLHHSGVISSSPANVREAVNAALLGAEALRSCRVRNGIMCLRALLTNCSEVLSFADSNGSSSSSTVSASHCERIVNCLLVKSGGGPRFIVELALNALLQQGVSRVPPLALASALFPSLSHRNPEISGNAILALVASVRKLDASMLHNTAAESMQCLHEVIQGLALALNAKRAKAKDEAKAALKTIRATTGEAHFESLLTLHLNASQMGEVTRLLSTASTSATPGAHAGSALCTPASASAQPRSVAASAGDSVMRMSLSEQRSGLPRAPLRVASSAQGGVAGSGVSKFKLHMQATALSTAKAGAAHARMDVMTEGVEILCAVAAPSRAPTPNVSVTAPVPMSVDQVQVSQVTAGVVPSSSAASTVPSKTTVAATPPVSSLRDHILRMKQLKRAAEAEQRAAKACAEEVVSETKECSGEAGAVASSVQADVMNVCPTPFESRVSSEDKNC